MKTCEVSKGGALLSVDNFEKKFTTCLEMKRWLCGSPFDKPGMCYMFMNIPPLWFLMHMYKNTKITHEFFSQNSLLLIPTTNYSVIVKEPCKHIASTT